MPIAQVYPFASIGDAGSYPDWIRGLRHVSGVYLIHSQYLDAIAYIGESHSDRLYSTLTRHFQEWSNAYDTAGATYERHDVEVAIVVVPAEHALYLQNEMICALDPVENRLKCDQLFALYEEFDVAPDSDVYIPAKDGPPPPGYDYNIDLLLEGIAYQWPDDGKLQIDVPF